jgi:hypothetical protein
MLTVVPDPAVACGFVNEPVGTHTSRTIMVPELRMLLAAVASTAEYPTIRAAVVDDNVCGKATVSGRRELFRRLSELYSFRSDAAIYRAFRLLWNTDAPDAPLLAMLLACARDPLLRSTAPIVLDAAPGDHLTPHELADVVEAAFPFRYSPIIRSSAGRHTIASWAQSGHLRGRATKIRACAEAGPASTAFALYLGYLCGSRGIGLYSTLWARILDAEPASIDRHAFAAAQHGWLDYRRIDDVVDLGFGYLDAACRSAR